VAHEDWRGNLDRLLAGDRVAFVKFARIVTGTLSGIRAYDFRDEWDDLVQDVLWIVVEAARAGKIRNPDAIVGFVRTTTHQRFRAHLRKAKRYDYEEDMDEGAHAAWPPEESPAIPAEEIWEHIRRLPEKQRIVMEGVYRDGMTVPELVRTSGIPEGSVKRFLREALATVGKRIAAETQVIR
jgi:RNA polymerase sigma factor (sigma-70 family)